MKKIIVLLVFTLISVNFYSQNLTSAARSANNSTQQENEGDLDLDQGQNERQNQNPPASSANSGNPSGTEPGNPEATEPGNPGVIEQGNPEGAEPGNSDQTPIVVDQNFIHFFGVRLGFGYNALYNTKSLYNKDSAAVLLGINYSVFFLKLSDSVRLGLLFNFSVNIWTDSANEEEDAFYTYKYHKMPSYAAFEMSLLPAIKYNKYIFGIGMYFSFTSTRWKLYDGLPSDDAINIFTDPKVKSQDYGIAAMIGYIHRGPGATIMVGLEFKFSVNKPILYYDYYSTGTFPYTQRGAFRGDGNYFTILFFFTVGGAW